MNRSWPLRAATSAAASALIFSTGMWSTPALVSCCLPHSAASSPSNHWSNSGTKWAHFAILRVFGLLAARLGKRKKGPLAAVAAANLTKSRRRRFVPLLFAILAIPQDRNFPPLPGRLPGKGVICEAARALALTPLRDARPRRRGATHAHAVHGELAGRLQAREVSGKACVEFCVPWS